MVLARIWWWRALSRERIPRPPNPAKAEPGCQVPHGGTPPRNLRTVPRTKTKSRPRNPKLPISLPLTIFGHRGPLTPPRNQNTPAQTNSKAPFLEVAGCSRSRCAVCVCILFVVTKMLETRKKFSRYTILCFTQFAK